MNGLWSSAMILALDQVELEYVQAQHPPDKKKRDCRNYYVANPLSSGLWLGAIGHGQRIAPGLRHSLNASG